MDWQARRAEEDARAYRDGYPGKRDEPAANQNLLFYQNRIVSKPDGVLPYPP